MMVINNLNNTSDNYAEKLQRCQEYVDALEEERRKIQVFQRELPLCLELVTQAIEACKQQLTSSTPEYNFHGQSECSEQISSEGPVLEEFIPIKRAASSDDDDEQQSKKHNNNKNCDSNDDNITKDSKNNDNKASKKSDWLRSAQLWNQTPDPTPKEDSPKKVEVKKNGIGGAFHPFKREKSMGTSSTSAQGPSGGGKSLPAVAPSSSAETGGSSGGGNGGKNKEEKEGQSQRKQRRCWSPELHRRFLQALQQLGGSHVATPKQIRELMKVDGLTNDEVKSHLQKYRLHTRRPSPSIRNTPTPQPPQFVVVGGIWVPPPEYATMPTPTASGEASGAANSNGIYAPIAALPPAVQDASMSLKQRKQHKKLHSNDRGSHNEGCGDGGGGGHRANSPDSSSSDTTTASPPAY